MGGVDVNRLLRGLLFCFINFNMVTKLEIEKTF